MAARQPPSLYLVGVDGSAPANHALRFALSLAGATGARLRVVTVPVPGPSAPMTLVGPGFSMVDTDPEKDARAAIVAANAILKEARADAQTAILATGDPASRLVAEARSCGASMLVVGSHGHRGLERLLLGSVAERVVRESPCPVLVVR